MRKKPHPDTLPSEACVRRSPNWANACSAGEEQSGRTATNVSAEAIDWTWALADSRSTVSQAPCLMFNQTPPPLALFLGEAVPEARSGKDLEAPVRTACEAHWRRVTRPARLHYSRSNSRSSTVTYKLLAAMLAEKAGLSSDICRDHQPQACTPSPFVCAALALRVREVCSPRSPSRKRKMTSLRYLCINCFSSCFPLSLSLSSLSLSLSLSFSLSLSLSLSISLSPFPFPFLMRLSLSFLTSTVSSLPSFYLGIYRLNSSYVYHTWCMYAL